MQITGSIDFSITEQTEDQVVADMPLQPGIMNPFGVVHAGAMLWLADVSATVLVMGHTQPTAGMKGFPLAISLNAHFMSNLREGSLRAVSRYVKRGRSVSVVRTSVSDPAGKLVAEVTTSHVLSQ